MNAKELYIKETGIKPPDNVMSYFEWFADYVKWLEAKVEGKAHTGQAYELVMKYCNICGGTPLRKYETFMKCAKCGAIGSL